MKWTNCTQTEKLIPLYVGGDLEAPEFELLREHLESCTRCRKLSAEFEQSRHWLMGFTSPQFDEAVFDDLRSAVRNEIVQAQTRPSIFDWLTPVWNPRFAAVSLAVLLMLAAFGIYFYRSQLTDQTPMARRDADKTTPDLSPRSGRQDVAPGGAKRNPGNGALANSSPRSGRQKTPPRQSALEPKQEIIALNNDLPDQSLISDEPEHRPDMLRIEFQTTDPKIRIIWLTPKDSTMASTQSDSIHR